MEKVKVQGWAGEGTWHGWAEIDGKKMYLKSKWEYKYCLYLDFMKKQGHIIDWEYEPITFWFEGIKRGTTSYKPDFRVQFPSGAFEFIEVKGYQTAKDGTKWKRMAKYHPTVKLRVIDGKWFSLVGKQLGKIIKGWQ
jgi:hypothetical protein